ncbi:phosphotransferase ydiA [Deinococcus grandis]|uniref:Putative phosphoenolpyruvate synthase regulatory protein n=1 Tax=Deinococcus grandis TaxID=57498 RepID=A0A124BSB8_9DEIO|nr:pyruvate, water dikinase regulatory protein [Deinococcus grandis]BBN96850.1 putative phosphoenolpyruvate synthase regulatory protein [Deinococcus grandis]GAQ23866.1 phosphotransferase ydiA [Deinococcus grandis]
MTGGAAAAGPRPVLIVSDHTGLTAENAARALLAHFPEQSLAYLQRPFVATVEAARGVAQEVATLASGGERPLVFTTITEPEVMRELEVVPARVFDLLGPGLSLLEEEFGERATRSVGRHHDMHDQTSYLARMDALDFALATDDGLGDRQYGLADVILVGVSRAGKTPTSLFLALQHGVRASNYPLAEDDFERESLPIPLEPYRTKLHGLTIDPRRLHAIRTQRKPNSRYASLEQCEHEVRRAERLFARAGIPVRDTTSASVEEIAAGILTQLRRV